jgi:hypothetical protein
MLSGFEFELKNVENLVIWSAIKQANARLGMGHMPAVIAKRNRRAFVAVVPFGWVYSTHTGSTLPPMATVADLGHPHLHDAVFSLPGIVPTHAVEDQPEKRRASERVWGALWDKTRVVVHGASVMRFWPTVDSAGPDAIVVFNRGDAKHVIYAAVPWPLFASLLVKAAPQLPPSVTGAASAFPDDEEDDGVEA